jgi:hypothetical protein
MAAFSAYEVFNLDSLAVSAILAISFLPFPLFLRVQRF